MTVCRYLILATAFFAAACAETPSAAERAEIMTATGLLEAARGVWRSDESGWLLEITEEGITRWQETGPACYPSAPDGPTSMGQIEYQYFTPLTYDTARFEYLPGDGHAVFERIEGLPARCMPRDDWSALDVFEVFVAIFDRHYAFFERRGVDWAALTDTARAQVTEEISDAELFAILSSLIEPLGDSHTKLFAEVEGEGVRAQFGLGHTLPLVDETIGQGAWLGGIVGALEEDVLDPGTEHLGNGRVILGTIEGRVGYIQFFTMGGFVEREDVGSPAWAAAELAALDEIMNAAMARFEGLDAAIVDLSNNRGGFDAVCRAIGARFAEAPFTGYTVRDAWDGPVLAEYVIEPADAPRFAGPVFVLTSDVTVSCGEITTMILRQLPNVTHVGATTRGAFSTPLAKPLPNGWYVELSNEIFADGAGEVFEGRGITPVIEADPFPADALTQGHARAIEAIMARVPAR